ncbi:MAG: imelysin family protein [Candidatus Thioglobus sp.]|nr:imelysin family protein [Candidatus Thioglobus sp.]
MNTSKILAVSIMAATFSLSVNATGQQSNVLRTYADIATANYIDALNDAKSLQNAIQQFTSSPSLDSMNHAKAAWLVSRESYGQTEAFRLSNGPIDAEEGWHADLYGAPEGQLNAWPLDEGMIDYTVDADGNRTAGNIIDTTSKMFNPGGENPEAVDVSSITMDAISALNENGGDANVATGYHAVEFLLWGQDQDYANFVDDSVTNGALTAGQRPLSDYTSDSNADRRKEYLNAAVDLIVSDLTSMTDAWEDNNSSNYKSALLGKSTTKSMNIDRETALRQIFSGLGVFIKSELANERIAVAVLTPSEEDEHSCFSDNTHRDIATNYLGFRNLVMGTYGGRDFGVAPIDAVKDKSVIMNLMASIEARIATINSLAETSKHFDYQIHPNDSQVREIIKLKNEMRSLGDQIVIVAKDNGISLTVGDVTDSEETQL